MSGVREIRTSLAVGFAEGAIPPRFENLRGRASRAIPAQPVFPYEDSQFDVVLMAHTCVSRALVKEANRVLKPSGLLCFQVFEKSAASGAGCFTLPEVYSLLRDGFNIIGLERKPWWCFWKRDIPSVITAEKKTWRANRSFSCGHSVPLSPFRSAK